MHVSHMYLFDAQPVSKVLGIGQSSGEPNHSHGPVRVRGNEVGTRHNHLQDWTPLITKEMDLVNYQHTHCLHIRPTRVIVKQIH